MIQSEFLTELDCYLKPGRGDKIWVLDEPLIYYSNILQRKIEVPGTFETDLSSVPRIPIVFCFWGGKSHREGVLHDYLFRRDSDPVVSFWMANSIFKEAMHCRKKSMFIRYGMYAGVVVGGYPSYHKKDVYDKL